MILTQKAAKTQRGKNELGSQGNQDIMTSDFQHFCEKALNDLRVKTAAHASMWGLGHAIQWDLNQNDGILLFTFTNTIVSCKAQIIGSWHKPSQTWRWAWSNQTVLPNLATQSAQIRLYGVEHGIEKLTVEQWIGTEDEAWQMASLACLIGDAQGVYRGPSGDSFVFIAFAEPQICKR